ncbi:MAG TPA: TolC family protein [Halothiobacillus sp.]|nr:TolC family protein [Halothiobacillus sp.]
MDRDTPLWIRGLSVRLMIVIGLLGGGISPGWTAEDTNQPLTLDAALTVPLNQQYDVMAAEAGLVAARANQAEVESWSDPMISVHGQLRYIQPSNVAPDQNNRHDNALGITARRQLFDFGRQDLRFDAAEEQVSGAKLSVLGSEQQQRLAILRAYFSVLMADQQYTVLNERMAVVYVRFDKAKDRKKLGMTSDYELAQLQRDYEDVLLARAKADASRRITRRHLAELMGTPDQIPAKLEKPRFAHLFDLKPPELDVAMAQMMRGDPILQSLRAEYSGSEHSLRAARDHNAPTIYAEVNGDYYQRELGSRDPFRAGVYIEFPLYDGGLRDAKIGKAQAARMRLQARIAAREATLREYATTLVDMIDVQRKAALSRVKALENYSDLNFTRKQTLYQMEKSTDLGDAMVEESAAQLERMRATFTLASYWAELAVLEGRPIMTAFSADSPASSVHVPPATHSTQEPKS